MAHSNSQRSVSDPMPLESVELIGCPKAKDFGHLVNKELANPISPIRWDHFPVLNSLDLHYFRKRCIFQLSECGGFVIIPNLKELMIQHSHIKELWGYKRKSSGFDKRDAPISDNPSLRILRLSGIHGLRHVGRPDSKTEDPLLPYLETLHVKFCDDLISLGPSPSASFRNLATLVVSNCDKVTELINPSTAKNMANLVTLEIESCRALKEIVAAEEDDDHSPQEHIIVFYKLKTLNLDNLDSLDGFCKGSSCYSFNFPCLDEVIIFGCSGMRIFCHGEVTMPKLQNIMLEGPFGDGQYCLLV